MVMERLKVDKTYKIHIRSFICLYSVCSVWFSRWDLRCWQGKERHWQKWSWREKQWVRRLSQTTTHNPHHQPATDQYRTLLSLRSPNQTLPLLTLQSAAVRRIFLGQKLRQTFTLSGPGPGGGLTVGRTAHAPEMDWFLVVMQAGNWQQSDGWWNSWPVTVKIYSPDQTQSMKRLASRESLGLQNDIRIIKNIIEETVNSVEVNGKWLSSIYGAIIS